jgi:hypothetical protein
VGGEIVVSRPSATASLTGRRQKRPSNKCLGRGERKEEGRGSEALSGGLTGMH